MSVWQVSDSMIDLWRVYRSEWQGVYHSDAVGPAGLRECRQRFAEKFEGKVREEDVRYAPWARDHPESYPWIIRLWLPTVRAEFKHREAAGEYVRQMLWTGAKIVERGSPEEVELISYGTRMLKPEQS
jgi:hypothetical protein